MILIFLLFSVWLCILIIAVFLADCLIAATPLESEEVVAIVNKLPGSAVHTLELCGTVRFVHVCMTGEGLIVVGTDIDQEGVKAIAESSYNKLRFLDMSSRFSLVHLSLFLHSGFSLVISSTHELHPKMVSISSEHFHSLWYRDVFEKRYFFESLYSTIGRCVYHCKLMTNVDE